MTDVARAESHGYRTWYANALDASAQAKRDFRARRRALLTPQSTTDHA